MIYLITDQWPGEPDILTPIRNEVLYIRDLDGELLSQVHPSNKSWTHEALVEVIENLSEHRVCEHGADAYLGGYWVGSTEC